MSMVRVPTICQSACVPCCWPRPATSASNPSCVEYPALTRARLAWIQQSYIRADTITTANNRLVDVHAALPMTKALGGGELASADGIRFVVPVRSVHAAANPKYFGRGQGVTYINYTSAGSIGFFGFVVPGTLRDSMVILDGLLQQQTTLRPTTLVTDSASYSDIVFGLFMLLGYRFCPRLADLLSRDSGGGWLSLSALLFSRRLRWRLPHPRSALPRVP